MGGGLAFAIALFAIAQVTIDPSAAEGGIIGGLAFVLVLLALAASSSVNGPSLLRRNPAARPIIAISSIVLLIPTAVGAVTGIGIPGLVVVVASLWLTLSKSSRETFESYMARAIG